MQGAIGSLLIERGIRPFSCLEELNETNPNLIIKLYQEYRHSGAEILVTNSFGANEVRYPEQKRRLPYWNERSVMLCREAAPSTTVYASIGPLGGDFERLKPTQSRRAFEEQIESLERGRPDGYLVETMTSLEEAEIAAQAVREVSNRPLMVTITEPGGVSIDQPFMSRRLRAAGADILGYNCGIHPSEAVHFFERFCEVDPGPWCARPACGTPTTPVSFDEFLNSAKRLIELGVTYLGGCCGTTPAHIRLLQEKLAGPHR